MRTEVRRGPCQIESRQEKANYFKVLSLYMFWQTCNLYFCFSLFQVAFLVNSFHQEYLWWMQYDTFMLLCRYDVYSFIHNHWTIVMIVCPLKKFLLTVAAPWASVGTLGMLMLRSCTCTILTVSIDGSPLVHKPSTVWAFQCCANCDYFIMVCNCYYNGISINGIFMPQFKMFGVKETFIA